MSDEAGILVVVAQLVAAQGRYQPPCVVQAGGIAVNDYAVKATGCQHKDIGFAARRNGSCCGLLIYAVAAGPILVAGQQSIQSR